MRADAADVLMMPVAGPPAERRNEAEGGALTDEAFGQSLVDAIATAAREVAEGALAHRALAKGKARPTVRKRGDNRKGGVQDAELAIELAGSMRHQVFQTQDEDVAGAKPQSGRGRAGAVGAGRSGSRDLEKKDPGGGAASPTKPESAAELAQRAHLGRHRSVALHQPGFGKEVSDATTRPRRPVPVQLDAAAGKTDVNTAAHLSLTVRDRAASREGLDHQGGDGGHSKGQEISRAPDSFAAAAPIQKAFTVAAAPVAPGPLTDLDPMIANLGARVSLSPGQAQISLDAGAAGDLSLYVRVHDGTTDVRVQGAAAHLVDARLPELRAALSQEGLSLGSFAMGGQGFSDGSGGGAAQDRASAPISPPGTAPATASASAAMKMTGTSPPAKRRVHVTA